MLTKYSKSKKKVLKVKDNVEKRYEILLVIIIVLMFVLGINLFYVQITKNSFYKEKVLELTKKTVLGNSAPRGRIYDRNHKLIVDNKPVKGIYYKKDKNLSILDELDMAYKAVKILDLKYDLVSEYDLKTVLLILKPELGKNKITKEEWQLLEERKLSANDIEKYQYERITKEELDSLNEEDRKVSYLYKLMTKGYSFDEKLIKKNASDLEYSKIAGLESVLKGFYVELDWERTYPYGDVFKTILGTVSSIPAEKKDEYLKKGYALTDIVGSSYLELQYENYLKGIKNEYYVDINGVKHLEKEGSRGNDLVISIDIELQKMVEDIIVSELLKAKKEPNTEYLNRSFVIVTDPKTGEILAASGKQIVKNNTGYDVYDYTPGIVTSPVVPGSVVKGASHIVGYNNGAITFGEVRDDVCLKIASTPLKCSWKYLGKVNDITALKYSSNTYQYRTAIKVGKGSYIYGNPLSLDLKAYDTYRKTFNEFGLGVKTGVDLPIESEGYKGKSSDASLLLAFAIGQYDAYTPMQLSQYIATIANGGKRMKPSFLKAVYYPSKDGLNKLKEEIKPSIMNEITTKKEYLDRVRQGFNEVLKPGGTGYYTIYPEHNPAGKTGTSQTFVDSDANGVIDTETISTAFLGYAPFDDPKVTFTVISPDVAHYVNSTYQSNVNAKITQQVSKKFFEIYK